MELLVQLARSLPLTLAALALLLVAAVGVAIVLARRARIPGVGLPETDELPLGEEQVTWVDLRSRISAALRRTFRDARRLARRSGLEENPRFLLLGQSASGKTTLVEHVPLPLPAGHPAPPETAGTPALGWWAFEEATVLDVPGAWVMRLDGGSSDEAAWMSLLRLARESRPRRPADGVILTVPADSLLAPARPAAELRAEAARRGARLYDKLVQVQQVLGLCLPVTVVLTRCDLIPGFSTFVGSVPRELRQQIFGWSVPEPPDTPYQDAWAGEAMSALASGAERSVGNTAAADEAGAGEGEETATPPSFADNLRALTPLVGIYLSQLFARGAPGDSSFFRGLYLCGGCFGTDGEPADPACEVPRISAVVAARPESVVFLRDLLQRKALPEAVLGRPAPQAEAARHHRGWLLRTACILVPLLGCVALWWAHGRAASGARQLEPLVRLVEGYLGADLGRGGAGGAEEGRSGRRAGTDLCATRLGGAEQAQLRREQALQMVGAVREIERYRLRSPLLPASWLSPLDARVEAVLVRGTNDVLLGALHRSLEESACRLEHTIVPRGAAQTEITAPDETPEFRHLVRYVAGVRAFEHDRSAYQCLEVKCGSRHLLLADFRRLTRSLWDERFELPGGAAERYWGGVLRRAKAPSLAVSPEAGDRFTATTRSLTHELYRALFVTNPVLRELRALQDELDRLGAAGGLPGADAETYRRLQRQISRLEEDLARPELAWMTAERLDLGPGMEGVWEAIDRSPDLGPALHAELAADGEENFHRLQAWLLRLSTAATGPLLAQKNGRVELALSDGVEQVGQAVDSLLAQSFMAPEERLAPWTPGPRERFTWDTALLQQAAALIPSYDDYIAMGLEAFPAELRLSTAEVALDAMGDHVTDLVARAQRLGSAPDSRPPQPLEQDVAARSANLQAADQTLDQIVGGLARLGLEGRAAEISAVATRQALQLLLDANRLLRDEDLYRPREGDFSWWDGLTPPSPEAFGAATSKQLGTYLMTQRQIVTNLGHYAEPALSGVARRGEVLEPRDAALVARWSALLTDLEEAKDKVPGSPVTVLETFIAKDLTALTLAQCLEDVAPEVWPPPSDDYFDERLRRLETTLQERCVDLATGYGGACYAEMAALFNDRLAGEFPFSAHEPGLFDTDAQPEALAAFYRIFDRSGWLVPEVPEERHAFGSDERAVRQFVERMGRVRPLVAPYLDDPKTYPTPALGFTVEFRVNRGEEVGAEDVLGWQLDVGKKSYRRGEESLTGNWTYGAPVKLELDWAQDSPVVPTEVVASELGRVQGRQVIYEYDDPWALVSLLRDHPTAAADFPDFADVEPTTFKVEVKTGHEAAGTLTSSSTAELFVRLVLLTPDKKQVVPWPEVFPVLAPPFEARRGTWTCPDALQPPTTRAAAAAPAEPAAATGTPTPGGR